MARWYEERALVRSECGLVLAREDEGVPRRACRGWGALSGAGARGVGGAGAGAGGVLLRRREKKAGEPGQRTSAGPGRRAGAQRK